MEVVSKVADPMGRFPSTKYSGRANIYDYVSSTVTSIPSGGKYRNQSNVYWQVFLINPANPANNDCYK